MILGLVVGQDLLSAVDAAVGLKNIQYSILLSNHRVNNVLPVKGAILAHRPLRFVGRK